MKHFKTILITFVVTLVIISSIFVYFYKDYIKVENGKIEKVESDSLTTDSNKTEEPAVENVIKNDNQITNSRQTVITRAVEKVSPAIVGITVTEIRQLFRPTDIF